MDNIVEIICKGFLIGLLVSAPMGPIGVLCIQRTLNEGQMRGFISGVGATMSDLVFALIAGLGMGFIMDFIQANHYPIQIAGSVVLLVFGAYIYKSNPAEKLLKQNESKSPYWKNLVSAFLINLTNIGILFFFIAMFARFNFIDPNKNSQNAIGILSIGLGAIVWWLVISTLVNYLRRMFNPRALKIFNKVLGLVLMLIGLLGLLSGIYGWVKLY